MAVSRQILVAACALGASSSLWAQPGTGIRRPAAAQRVLRVFDFEEREINDFSVPLWWHVAQHDPPHRERPGFPIWNMPRLDYTVAAAGEGSVKLGVQGGSVGLQLDTGVAPVFPGADYQVTTSVRTQDLREARARLRILLLDQAGAPIPGSESTSGLAQSEATWTTLSAKVLGTFDNAAFLQVNLEVVQPEHFRGSPLGPYEVRRQDFEAAAWFDDVTITQLARVEIEATTPSHVFAGSSRPELQVLVRDLTGDELHARVRVSDLSGRIVDQMEFDIDGGQVLRTWAPKVPQLGWYRAEVLVGSVDGVLARSQCDFAWVNPAPAARSVDDGPAFALLVEDLPPALDPALGDLASHLGVDEVIIPIFANQLADTAAAIERFRALLAAVHDRWKTVTLAVGRLPQEVASDAHVDATDAVGFIARRAPAWENLYLPVVDRFSQRVLRWQIGHDGDDRFARDDKARGELTQARRRLRDLAAGSRLIAPWGVFDQPPTDSPTDVEWTVGAPASLHPEGLGQLVARWREQADAPLSLVLDTINPDVHGVEAVASDVILRLAAIWQNLETSRPDAPQVTIAMRAPWEVRGTRTLRPAPTPAAAVWRNAIDQFSGRRFAGEWSLAPGVRCLILAPREGSRKDAALVLWRERSATDTVEVAAMLAKSQVRVVDAFGNVRDLALESDRHAALHRLTVGAEPVFVEGIDLELSLFQAALTIEPEPLRSLAQPQERRLVLHNPWSGPITGRYFLVSPGGTDENNVRDRNWDISPRTGRFSIPASGTHEIPMTISFSPMTPTGPLDLVLDVELSGSEDYGLVTLRAPTEIVVNDFSLHLFVRPSPGPGGPDLVVEATVFNRSAVTLDLEIALFAGDDFGRMNSSVSNLEPNQAALRRFPLRGAANTTGDRQIFISVLDRATGVRLNRSATLD